MSDIFVDGVYRLPEHLRPARPLMACLHLERGEMVTLYPDGRVVTTPSGLPLWERNAEQIAAWYA